MTDDPFADLPSIDDIEADQAAPDDPEWMQARLREGALIPLNDTGNGRRFLLHFADRVMFVPRVGWFVWDGRVWQKDEDQMEVRGLAQQLQAFIAREAAYVDLTERERRQFDAQGPAGEVKARAVVAKRRARHIGFAVSTGNSGRIENALREAEIGAGVPYKALDADPLLLACETGVLRFVVDDMREEGAGRVARVELLPHERGQRITKLAPVSWDPDAACPRWHAFLQRIQPDAEMRGFLQRWLGFSLTGVKLQRMAFFHGSGANGKSVLVDTIARIAGAYSATARIESLTGTNRRDGSSATPDLIPLMGARFVRTSEPDEGQRLQEGLLKELTGGEPIMVRPLHGAFVEEEPRFKLTMSGNHKPDVRGTDDGIWRRLMLVPFDVQIPEEERDPDLVDRLWEERAGIFAWLVEGLCEALEVGVQPPSSVVAATQEYRAESDPVGQFLTACCVVSGSSDDVIETRALVDGFALFLIERGMPPWTGTKFSKQLASKAGVWRHPANGLTFARGSSSVRSTYLGLRLDDLFRRRVDAAPRDPRGNVTVPRPGSQD